jgi:hypothetical protein
MAARIALLKLATPTANRELLLVQLAETGVKLNVNAERFAEISYAASKGGFRVPLPVPNLNPPRPVVLEPPTIEPVKPESAEIAVAKIAKESNSMRKIPLKHPAPRVQGPSAHMAKNLSVEEKYQLRLKRKRELAILTKPNIKTLIKPQPDSRTLAKLPHDIKTPLKLPPNTKTLAKPPPDTKFSVKFPPDTRTLAKLQPDTGALAKLQPDTKPSVNFSPNTGTLAKPPPDTGTLAKLQPDTRPLSKLERSYPQKKETKHLSELDSNR